MNRQLQTRIVSVLLCILFSLLTWSTAWADFYVIAVGQRAKNTILVSPQSTPSKSGDVLLSALNKAADASATNRYLILIEPGIFYLGNNSLAMKEYVDIQGSGKNVTIIKGSNSNNDGLIQGADHAELRFLTLRNQNNGPRAVALYNNGTSPVITNVHIRASGATRNYGIHNVSSASPEMNLVTVQVSGGESNYGVLNNSSSSPIMNNVRIEARGGLRNYGVNNTKDCIPEISNVHILATQGGDFNIGVLNNNEAILRINRSFIRGADSAVLTGHGSTTYIGSSVLSGAATVKGGGIHKCAASYSYGYDLLNNQCIP